MRACDYYPEFPLPKIVFPDISLRGNFTTDAAGKLHCGNTAYIIPVEDLYLLGLLNSELMNYLYRNISSSYRGGYLRYIYQYVSQLPIRNIGCSNKEISDKQNQITALVGKMLEMHRHPSTTPHEDEQLQRAIAATATEIDRLVYELYGLTD